MKMTEQNEKTGKKSSMQILHEGLREMYLKAVPPIDISDPNVKEVDYRNHVISRADYEQILEDTLSQIEDETERAYVGVILGSSKCPKLEERK